MAVRAEEGFAGLAEAFQMHLMANTVAGLGKINTMFSGYGLYVFMVISVFKAYKATHSQKKQGGTKLWD